MTARGHLVAIPVLAACTAGLGQAVNHLWNTPLTAPSAPSAAAGGELALWMPERLGSEMPGPPSLTLSEVLERPLFSPTRRPPPPEPQPVPESVPVTRVVTFVQEEPEPTAPASDWQDLRLIGVLHADEQRRALVTTPEDPEGTWLAEGEEVFGWRIDAIAANKIEVIFGEKRHTLSLEVD